MAEHKDLMPEQGVQDNRAEQDADPSQRAEIPAEGPEVASELEAARAKAAEYWEQVLRARAELENVRRHAERDLASAHKYALESFLRELVPIKDSLELGLEAARDSAADVAKVREGLALIDSMLLSTMEKFGVKRVDPLGQPFDPAKHQAMSTQPTPGVAPNTVVTVYQKGYLLHERVLRPAMVVVAARPEGEAGGEG